MRSAVAVLMLLLRLWVSEGTDRYQHFVGYQHQHDLPFGLVHQDNWDYMYSYSASDDQGKKKTKSSHGTKHYHKKGPILKTRHEPEKQKKHAAIPDTTCRKFKSKLLEFVSFSRGRHHSNCSPSKSKKSKYSSKSSKRHEITSKGHPTVIYRSSGGKGGKGSRFQSFIDFTDYLIPRDAVFLPPQTKPPIAPSSAPSSAPSPYPSTFPSNIPSNSPTVAPTLTASFLPTEPPSLAPTESSSNQPTLNPSIALTALPSPAPVASALTSSPTVSRMFDADSVSPTGSQTNEPTSLPSALVLTGAPTSQPAVDSTESPTTSVADVTESPTLLPSAIDTTPAPTVTPTTASPTTSPATESPTESFDGLRIRFNIEYTIDQTPSEEEFLVASEVTIAYVETFHEDQLSLNVETFIAERSGTLLDFTLASTIVGTYRFMVVFEDRSRFVPDADGLSAFLIAAFAAPSVNTLVADLQSLDGTFAGTSRVTYQRL